MRNKILLCAATMLASALPASAHAATVFNSLSAWQTAVGSFSRDTAYGTNFTNISGLTLSDGTNLGFGSSVNIRTIGSGWGTWSGGYTGQVLYSNGATSLSGTISPTGGFGFFVEPNPFSSYLFTLGLSDGSSVSGTYNGSAGAGFLGFAGNGITSFTITSATDFAFGDFYTTAATAGAVPEPATWAMMILGFAVVGGAMRKRQQAKVSFSF